MIVRILTAHVPRQNVGPFNDLLRAQLGELKDQPGLVYVKLARRLTENQGEEVVLVEEWRTPFELFQWTRGRLTMPRLLPGTEALVEDLVITHYEALDLSPEDLRLRMFGDPDSDDTATADEQPQLPPVASPEPVSSAGLPPKFI
jgi:hypothetical protein